MVLDEWLETLTRSAGLEKVKQRMLRFVPEEAERERLGRMGFKEFEMAAVRHKEFLPLKEYSRYPRLQQRLVALPGLLPLTRYSSRSPAPCSPSRSPTSASTSAQLSSSTRTSTSRRCSSTVRPPHPGEKRLDALARAFNRLYFYFLGFNVPLFHFTKFGLSPQFLARLKTSQLA